MTTPTKCAHPACDCFVDKHGPFGKFCSDHCREAGTFSALSCHSHHEGCGAATKPVSAVPEPPPA